MPGSVIEINSFDFSSCRIFIPQGVCTLSIEVLDSCEVGCSADCCTQNGQSKAGKFSSDFPSFSVEFLSKCNWTDPCGAEILKIWTILESEMSDVSGLMQVVVGMSLKLVKRKIVVVGDEKCGKTALIARYSQGTFVEEYVPTVAESYSSTGQSNVEICDTSGSEELDRLRPFSYDDATAWVVCYSFDNPQSLHNIIEKWIPEVKYCGPNLPIVVVGCKSDLQAQAIINPEEISDIISQVGAYGHIEVSALTGENVSSVFQLIQDSWDGQPSTSPVSASQNDVTGDAAVVGRAEGVAESVIDATPPTHVRAVESMERPSKRVNSTLDRYPHIRPPSVATTSSTGSSAVIVVDEEESKADELEVVDEVPEPGAPVHTSVESTPPRQPTGIEATPKSMDSNNTAVESNSSPPQSEPVTLSNKLPAEKPVAVNPTDDDIAPGEAEEPAPTTRLLSELSEEPPVKKDNAEFEKEYRTAPKDSSQPARPPPPRASPKRKEDSGCKCTIL
ncbi:P-loop containing nucleoside triphosphate hydrolase protein [Cladochytrium replicatum]|nr:P-loop containing nucleoside triphosphate hydrolase protein [Cladochytrium replicatum]